MVISYGCGQQWNWWQQKMQANCWRFRWPCGCGGTMRDASPDEAHPRLYYKPLDATIQRVPAPHCPGSRQGHQFLLQTQITNKTQLLASDRTVAQAKSHMNFGTRKGPSTHVIDATSCVKIWDNKHQEEELAHILSYQTLSADKNWKSYQGQTKLVKKMVAYMQPKG